MGYESKFYFVQKTDCIKRGNYYWAEVIATVDMCKIGGMPDCFKKPTNCYILEYGDKDILKDCYGDPLYECTVPELLDWIQRTKLKEGDGYRRWGVLEGTAEGFAQPSGSFIEVPEFEEYIREYIKDPRWKDLVVLHYGH